MIFLLKADGCGKLRSRLYDAVIRASNSVDKVDTDEHAGDGVKRRL